MAVILDIEMPINCCDCPCCDKDSGWCQVTGKAIFIERPHNCPLVEVKHGHWVRWYEEQKDEYGETYIPHCKCSECNKEFNPVASLSIKFCSNCGVKMDEEIIGIIPYKPDDFESEVEQ